MPPREQIVTQSAIFVSDIHITGPDCKRGRLFLAFLESLSGPQDVTHLYLLGDIFDLWVADHRYFVERYAEIIGEVRRLQREGVEISYFEGNHDLYLRHFWQHELGLNVYEGPIYATLGNTRLRLEHGDQADPDDRGYLFLRWFLRTGPVRFLTRRLPGAIIARIGDRASARSRLYTTHRKSIEPSVAIDKLREHASRAHAEASFDVIITGHIHVRDDCEIETQRGTFRNVNLGSWFDAPCYFKLDGNGAGFVEVSAEAPQGAATQSVESASGTS